MVDWQSLAGSAAFENSMHSSRFDFSSLQTQHGCRRYAISLQVNSAGREPCERKCRQTFGFSAVVAGATGCAIAGAAGIAKEMMLLRDLDWVRIEWKAYIYSRAEICEPISAVCANECVEGLNSQSWKSQKDY